MTSGSILSRNIKEIEDDEILEKLNFPLLGTRFNEDGEIEVYSKGSRDSTYHHYLNSKDVEELKKYGIERIRCDCDTFGFHEFYMEGDIIPDKKHQIEYIDYQHLTIKCLHASLGEAQEAAKDLNWVAENIWVDDPMFLRTWVGCNIVCRKIVFKGYIGIGMLETFNLRNTLRAKIIVFEDIDDMQQRGDLIAEHPSYSNFAGHHIKELSHIMGCEKVYFDFRQPYNDSPLWTREFRDLKNEDDVRKSCKKYTGLNFDKEMEKIKKWRRDKTIDGERWYFGIVNDFDSFMKNVLK